MINCPSHTKKPNYKKPNQLGRTIIELLITMTLSIILLGGMIAVILMNQTSVNVLARGARIEEMGYNALKLIVEDLDLSGFVAKQVDNNWWNHANFASVTQHGHSTTNTSPLPIFGCEKGFSSTMPESGYIVPTCNPSSTNKGAVSISFAVYQDNPNTVNDYIFYDADRAGWYSRWIDCQGNNVLIPGGGGAGSPPTPTNIVARSDYWSDGSDLYCRTFTLKNSVGPTNNLDPVSPAAIIASGVVNLNLRYLVPTTALTTAPTDTTLWFWAAPGDIPTNSAQQYQIVAVSLCVDIQDVVPVSFGLGNFDNGYTDCNWNKIDATKNEIDVTTPTRGKLIHRTFRDLITLRNVLSIGSST